MLWCLNLPSCSMFSSFLLLYVSLSAPPLIDRGPCPGHPNLVMVVDENLPHDGDDQFGLVVHFLSLSFSSASCISKNHSELKLFSTVVHSLPSVFNYWVADRSFKRETLVPGSRLKGRGRLGRALPDRSVWSGGTCYDPEQEQRWQPSNQLFSNFLYIVNLYEGNICDLFHLRFRLYVYIDLFMYVIYLDGYLIVLQIFSIKRKSLLPHSLFQAS